MEHLVARHREFAKSESNRSAAFRIRQLDALKEMLVRNRESIISALQSDLRKPEMECYASELAPVIREITWARKRLRRWMRRRRTGRGRFVIASPFGAALVIGTWNYPIQLILAPLVAAIAAGNGVTVKPSELAPRTATVIDDLLSSAFAPEAVSVVQGGPEIASSLIDAGYDKLFFTGSPRVGAIVAGRAAPHHTHVTLELGGKSPAIVGADSDIAFAAKRIVWGKFLNAGQTCMAPDYLLVHESRADEIVELMHGAVAQFFGPDPKLSPDFARIVNERHFDRLRGLLDAAGLTVPTDRGERYIAPTIVRCEPSSPLMREEIFGPILPVLAWKSFSDIERVIGENRNPLAVYLFSRDRTLERRVLADLDFGGAMVNDVILHAVDPRIPFGGRGSSGTGSYHGRYGFEAFTHLKGVARTRQGRAGSNRFAPYRSLPTWVRKLVFGV